VIGAPNASNLEDNVKKRINRKPLIKGKRKKPIIPAWWKPLKSKQKSRKLSKNIVLKFLKASFVGEKQ